MPVDDPNLSPQSSGSSGLSAEAREFVPKARVNSSDSSTFIGRVVNNGYGVSREQKHTGAVPKRSTFYNDDDNSRRRHNNNNSSRYNRSPRFQKNGNTPDESRKNAESVPKVEEKKFFKDNQNFYQQGRESRNDYDNSANNRSANSRPQPRDRHQDYYYEDRRNQLPKRISTRDARPPQKKPPPSINKFKKAPSVDPSTISQREQLIKDIENNKLECMICCDKIKDHQPSWSCSNCFHIQHLNCIKTWISKSKTDSGEWRCVHCQFLREKTPWDYLCFCGKQKYPIVSRNDLAHSCGEQCGRVDNCVHPCTLRCHPGPHIICQSSVERNCGCGKTSRIFQCSMKETFECDGVCEKVLSCGVHKCPKSCHQGSCDSCTELVTMTCYCEKDKKEDVCTVESALVTKYSCDKTCDRQLSCNNHRCELICHPQNCGSCLLTPDFIKSCPCGKTKFDNDTRKSCLNPIPLCKSQCSKALRCGPLASPHVCLKSCHLGDCPPCTKTTNVKCRCGRIEEKIACKNLLSTDVRCKKKCAKFRTCGKHRCNQNCCIDQEHVCTQQCGRMLECNKHRCQRPCHIGNCTPCHRVSFDELRCECGASVVYPPVPCGTRVPECTKKCQRRHKCNHPVNHLCHSDNDCPPCVFLTTKLCYGKHEQRKTIPCNQDSFSCGMACGKELKCERHKCIKTCHQNECEKPSDVCKQLCTIKRSECSHNCNAPCHTGDCPEKPCKVQVEVTCECGNLKEMKTCEVVADENHKLQRVKLALHMQQMQDGESVEMKDIYGDGSKKTVKILACNNECATLEQNRRLDIAFKVENPNLISYPKFIPNYSEFVRTFYKKESAFVNMAHDKLTELVKLSKESKQKSRSYSFPVMNRDKRHVIHDLAAMFGVETVAYDAEPNRNIVATASRETVSYVV